MECKDYEKPSMSVIVLPDDDVICASGDPNFPGDNDFDLG